MKNLTFALLTAFSLTMAACTAPLPAPPPTRADTAPVAVASPTPQAGVTVVDALGREVTLPALPQRIVLTGRALFMIADAIYTFPEAGQRIVGMGQTAQGSGNFVKLIDPNSAAKAVLERDAGAEQVAAIAF